MDKHNPSYSKLLFVALLALVAGAGLDRAWLLLQQNNKPDIAASKPLYWVAPMDPSYKRDQPGKSPMGMDLVPVYDEPGQANNSDAGAIKINPAVENNLGVRTVEVLPQDLQMAVKTVGFITFDEKKLTHFHSRVEGWIEKLAVTAVGDTIKTGQKLFSLYSPELVYAQQEFLSAIKSGMPALQESAEGKLKAWGVSHDQINKLRQRGKVKQWLEFYSEQEGYIANLNVREGMFIKPATTILSIGNLDTVWVIAEIFERQADWVKPGQAVRMQVDSYPGVSWEGQVDYVYPILDETTRTLQARIVFPNPEHKLKPNMFAHLSIYSEPKQSTLAIPLSALIHGGNNKRVVQALGEGRYRSTIVKTGIETEDQIEILDGLTAGDRVVTAAHFLIDSESNITADLNRSGSPQEVPAHHEHQGHHHD